LRELLQDERFTAGALDPRGPTGAVVTSGVLGVRDAAGGSLRRAFAAQSDPPAPMRADARRSKEFDGGTETMTKSQLLRISFYIRSPLHSQVLSAAARRFLAN
jgi:hypothetical protein